MPDGWDVLVIDDEAVVRDAVRRVLEGEGLAVATTATGQAGLAHVALSSCRLVICDLMLPDVAGFDLVAAVRGRRPGVPVVVITGYPTSENALRVVEAGASDFLPKPFTESELLAAVGRALLATDPSKTRRDA
jgi:DNA-binding NtrC family response regulator